MSHLRSNNKLMPLNGGLWLCLQGFYALWIRKRNAILTGAVENEKEIEDATAIVKSAYGVRKARNFPMIKK